MPSSARPVRALVADDEESIRIILSESLESEGFEVTTVRDGHEALAQLRSGPFEVVLTDIRMPGLTGIELLREIRSMACRAQVVVMTSHASLETSVEAVRLGAYDYVFKPFQDLRSVAIVLRRAAEQFRLMEQNEELIRTLQAANTQLAEATERKSRFLASMSHELRTPMNSIIGYTDLVLNRAGDGLDAKHRKNLERVRANADQLLALINDILDLSKVEAGRMELHLETFDVGKVLEGAAATAEVLLTDRPVQMVLKIDPFLPAIVTDKTKLGQIVLNLLSNACKFTEEGQVTLTAALDAASASVSARRLRIEVADTGVGMAQTSIASAFEEFRQIRNSRTGTTAGTGLGLAIVKKMVTLMGGEIQVASVDGKGSVFTVLLPTGPPPLAPS